MESVGATPQHEPLLAVDLVGPRCLLVGALAHSTKPSAGRLRPLCHFLLPWSFVYKS